MNDEQSRPKLLVIVGPTAVGKTALSLKIAEQFSAEIISGDSMQVYKGMDIGTAKATREDRERVPHHLLDIRRPDEPFSASDFQAAVRLKITEISDRGNLAMLVGGTGLYIESICYDYQFSEAGSDEALRKSLYEQADQKGNLVLYERLCEVDPAAAERIHPNDLRRLVRALEVFQLTGIPFSTHQRNRDQQKPSPFQLCLIGLHMDRALLYKRIEERVDEMLASGWLDEVKKLKEAGYGSELTSMQALGYKELYLYLDGEINWDFAVERIKRNTRRFAKRQLSWFRHMKEIEWFDLTERVNFTRQFQKISGIITEKLNPAIRPSGKNKPGTLYEGVNDDE